MATNEFRSPKNTNAAPTPSGVSLVHDEKEFETQSHMPTQRRLITFSVSEIDHANVRRSQTAVTEKKEPGLMRGNSLVKGQTHNNASDLLERNLLFRSGHALTEDEVNDVLIDQNVGRYKKLSFTKKQAVFDSCWRWVSGTSIFRNGCFERKREKRQILYKMGISKLDKALDIRNLVKSCQALGNL